MVNVRVCLKCKIRPIYTCKCNKGICKEHDRFLIGLGKRVGKITYRRDFTSMTGCVCRPGDMSWLKRLP